MGDRYRAADGWTVEVVELCATPDRSDGERLKVTYCGFFVESSGIAADGRERRLKCGALSVTSGYIHASAYAKSAALDKPFGGMA
jgi:hypothetical protein